MPTSNKEYGSHVCFYDIVCQQAKRSMGQISVSMTLMSASNKQYGSAVAAFKFCYSNNPHAETTLLFLVSI